METLLQLILDAELNLWFMSGSGLGAVMLCVIALAFLLRTNRGKFDLVRLLKAWRENRK